MPSSQSSLTWSQEAYDDITLGQQLMNDIVNQQQLDLDGHMLEECIFDDGGPSYDWHEAGLQSMLKYTDIDTINRCKTWLTDAKKEMKKSNCNTENSVPLILPPIQPLLVNDKQMYTVFMVVSP